MESRRKRCSDGERWKKGKDGEKQMEVWRSYKLRIQSCLVNDLPESVAFKRCEQKKPAAAERHQRLVLSVESSHSALNLLSIPHFSLKERKREKLVDDMPTTSF